MSYYGFDPGDVIPCEITGRPAVDISHNKSRGMGGSKELDEPENLMALTREAHAFLELHPTYRWWFNLLHYRYMQLRKPYAEDPISFTDPIFKEIKEKL